MNDLYFTAKNKKGLKDQSLSQKVYIIRHEVAGYHPSENEYISLSGEYLIKSQRNTPSVMIYTLKCDDIRMYISPQASYTFNDIPSLRLG